MGLDILIFHLVQQNIMQDVLLIFYVLQNLLFQTSNYDLHNLNMVLILVVQVSFYLLMN